MEADVCSVYHNPPWKILNTQYNQDAVRNSPEGNILSVIRAWMMNRMWECRECGGGSFGQRKWCGPMAKNAMWLDKESVLGIVQQTEKLGWRQFPKVPDPSLIKLYMWKIGY